MEVIVQLTFQMVSFVFVMLHLLNRCTAFHLVGYCSFVSEVVGEASLGKAFQSGVVSGSIALPAASSG